MTSNGHSAHHPPAEAPGSTVAGLARELEQVHRQVRGLRELPGRVDDLAATLAQLADTIAPSGPTSGKPAPCWISHPVDAGPDSARAADDAALLLARLADWVANVYLRYTDAVHGLPDCWMRHPDVVEELLWLQRAWLAAYDHGAPAGAVGDWHDRQRPGVVARIRATVGTCSIDAHRPRAGQDDGPAMQPADDVDVIAQWWATARDRPAPTPTERQLTAAWARYRTTRR